jgi:hypothetical protein
MATVEDVLQDNSASGDYGKINNKNHMDKLKRLL